jgi:AraC-like DNA-binding protein
MAHGFHLTTADPEQFEEQMAPLVGRPRVRPARRVHFDVSVRAKRLSTLSLFTVKAASLMVDLAPPHRFFGLNIPLGRCFSTTNGTRRQEFSDDVHLLMPDRHFHLEVASECRILAVCLDSDQVNDYALRLSGSQRSYSFEGKTRMPLSTPVRVALVRKLARLWSDVQRSHAPVTSDIDLAEREDAIVTAYLLAMQAPTQPDWPALGQPDTAVISRAEEYLYAHLTRPVSRAALAAATEVSIRTLSRAFAKRWGTGPMGFLKARRLDAANRELLGAAPGETTVTDVAYRYGFSHLGKFALEYKRAFGESPSATLRH